MTFHELCAALTTRAGLSPPADVPKSQLFEEIWPELLMEAYDCVVDERYDAIIVDEGQDFLPLWWTAIDAGLTAGDSGLLRVFYDDNQRVYASANNLPAEVDLVPIRLTLNLRNTRRIHELVRQHYTGHEINAAGPEGSRGPLDQIEHAGRAGTTRFENVLRVCIHMKACHPTTLRSW